MKHIFTSKNITRLLFVFGLCIPFLGSAQNKTFGVGTTTTNSNAALHVESPTNNQGIIIPRLTTAQRVAITLGTSDVGLIVYDTDLKDIVTWTGTTWDIAGVSTDASPAISAVTTGSGNAGSFTVNNATNNTSAIYATTNGVPGATDAALSSAILAETNTAFSAITGRVTSGTPNAISGITKSTDPGSWAGFFSAETGTAVYGSTKSNVGGALAPVGVYGESLGTGSSGGAFRINNAANNLSALYAETNGTGSSGFFKTINASNTTPALYAETNGSGHAVHGLNIGSGNGAYFRKNGATGSTAAMWADNFGSNGYGGIIQNVGSSPKAALLVEAVGTGPSLWANKDATETGNSIDALHAGTVGNAGNFVISNNANTNPAIHASTNGSGAAISAENNGTSNGFAGLFSNTQSGNTFPAIQASTAGSGSGVRVMQTAGPGPGMDVFMQNATSNAPGVAVDHQGLGIAGKFQVSNASNSFPSVYAETVGTGRGGLFYINNTSNVSPAVQGRTNGQGSAVSGLNEGTSGNAGAFDITNSSNALPALVASTNGTGPAISAIHSNGGLALDLQNGGIRFSVASVSTTPITQRAGIVDITATGSYTLSTAGRVNGEVVYVTTNQTGVTVESSTVTVNTTKAFVFIGSSWRILN